MASQSSCTTEAKQHIIRDMAYASTVLT
jgi:hypothetical protein